MYGDSLPNVGVTFLKNTMSDKIKAYGDSGNTGTATTANTC